MTPPSPTTTTTTIGILLEDYFDEREVIYPFFRVQESGFTPLLIGPKPGTYHGKTPFTLEATVGADTVRAEDLAGLIVPGGFAPDRMRRHRSMTGLIAEVDQQNKPLGAICHAGWALISAGIVRGRRLTGFSSIREDLENAGAVYVAEERVVREGHLVTAQHADDCAAFMVQYLEAFSNER